MTHSDPSGPWTPLERELVNRFQGGFPLTQRPFAHLAEQLDSDEISVIHSIRSLLEDGRLTRFGPLFNAERMGGSLVLAAMEVPEDQFERVAQQVNGFPETAHNYRRDHRLNMWFVLATDSPEGMENTLERMTMETGYRVYPFPKEREYYLGLWFELDHQGSGHTRSIPEPPLQPVYPLDALDRRIVAASQQGLPLTPEPYNDLAEQAACSPAQLLERLQKMLASGAIRRIGLVPNHYKLGFRSNGMTVWDIPDDQLDLIGKRLAALDFVSHCYARPRYLPHWPYNLFAMVHGHHAAQVGEKVRQMEQLAAPHCRGQDTLFSKAILKKTGMRLAI